MAAADSLLATRRGLAALLFLEGAGRAYEVFSSLMSSPWTIGSFGATEDKAKWAKELIWHGIGLSAFYGIASSVIAGNVWPLVGMSIAVGYMWWLYRKGFKKAQESGSTSWADGTGAA